MQAKPVFLLTTVLGLFFGFMLMFLPEMMMDMNEVTYLEGGPGMAQHAASWILAASVFAFLIRNEEHSNYRQATFIMFSLAFGLMTIVELYSFFMAISNVNTWSIIALHALVVILYTYLFIKNR
ncbi:MAG: hypothetical protein KAU48_01175 [Candidatus Thorarchaeota archaeon]|nr:hypothetical protein [Candidatus Thorarchaeota archaeon]